MSHKLKVKCLVPVWGKKYIDHYLSIAVPTLLTPGNLPCMATETELEFLILTTETSIPFFHENPAFSVLKSICPIRFIHIDDLMGSSIYGVTLTLAYARGIRESGAEQINTYFLFMNSDFLYAEGSFKTLTSLILAGETCIVAPSLRVATENVLPILEKYRDTSHHTMIVPSREMVKASLGNLHPTVIAKTVNQKYLTCETYNQLYWRVDEDTLLARHYLIFMMVIKPEVEMPPVTSYCDYGFIPELAPKARIHVLNDSDDFFMLELQDLNQEFSFIHVKHTSLTTKEVAAKLSAWVTAEHIEVSKTDIVFHAADLPVSLKQYKSAAHKFISRINKRISKPKGHAHHFYWTSGLHHWLIQRSEQSLKTTPLELPQSIQSSSVAKKRRFFIGEKPYIPIWHRDWADFYALTRWLRKIPSNKKSLIFAPEESEVVQKICARGTFEFKNETEIEKCNFAILDDLKNTGGVDNVLFYNGKTENILKVLAYLRENNLILKNAQTAVCFVSSHAYLYSYFAPKAILDFSGVAGKMSWTKDMDVNYAGGTLRNYVSKLHVMLISKYSSSHCPVKKKVFLLLLLAVLPITVLNNIRQVMVRKRDPLKCTSIFLTRPL